MIKKRALIPTQDGAYQILLGRGRTLIIDAESVHLVKLNTLKIRRSNTHYYVKIFIRSHGRRVERMLHRIINNTPPDKQCHHINGDTFDNRKSNLENLDPAEHARQTAQARITVNK